MNNASINNHRSPQHPSLKHSSNLCTSQEANAATLDLSADDPDVLASMIHYFYHFTLLEAKPSSSPGSPSIVHTYAIADKYDVQPLRKLAEDRFRKIYNPSVYVPDVDALIATIHAVDENTAHEISSGGGLWAILLPTLKAKMSLLLGFEAFRELLLDMPDLNFCMLGMVAQNKPAVPSPITKPPMKYDDDSESEDEGHRVIPPGRYGRYGVGRTLG